LLLKCMLYLLKKHSNHTEVAKILINFFSIRAKAL
jgi:hypothetical protein